MPRPRRSSSSRHTCLTRKDPKTPRMIPRLTSSPRIQSRSGMHQPYMSFDRHRSLRRRLASRLFLSEFSFHLFAPAPLRRQSKRLLHTPYMVHPMSSCQSHQSSECTQCSTANHKRDHLHRNRSSTRPGKLCHSCSASQSCTLPRSLT
jgi:hypothetical protein